MLHVAVGAACASAPQPSTEQLLQQQQQQQQLAAQAAQLLLGGADGGRGINANGDIDVAMVEQVLQVSVTAIACVSANLCVGDVV
jgi:hypothetical protein